jgi:hypothetical protein
VAATRVSPAKGSFGIPISMGLPVHVVEIKIYHTD